MKKILSQVTQAPQTAIRFMREAFDELRKVSWPSRETTVRYTVIVIVSSLVVGIVIGGLDYLFTFLLEVVLQRI